MHPYRHEQGAGPADADEAPAGKRKSAAKKEHAIVETAGRELRVSSPGKLFFPERRLTKLDLVNYYVECHEAVLLGLRERPCVMKRWVDGVQGKPFFQKRVPDSAPEWLQTATVTFPSGRHARELVVNDAAHLVWGVNLGVIDWNPWPVRRADLDHPDELRVDLDPEPEVPFDEVRQVALGVRDVLDEHGLRGFPKTSGSRGIHVFVRIAPAHSFHEVRRAALALAREVERRMPGRATTRWWKEQREGVFIDYNQNARDRTVASAYSVRAVPDARVSCPWSGTRSPTSTPPSCAWTPFPPACASGAIPAAAIDGHPGSLEACSSSPPATNATASATRPGRRTSASSAASRAACSRVAPSPPRAPGSEPDTGLPLTPPLKPQLALSRSELPVGEEYLYEIKLDGFRCLAFVDGEEVFLQSRNGRPLGRYFPELSFPAGRYVLDGEIVVRGADGREDFDALGQRIHPADSRIQRLAVETPAVYVAFDLLARDEQALLERPFAERRAALEALLAETSFTAAPIELMPTVDTAEEAQRWLREAEGAMAKERSAPYLPGSAQGHVQGQARPHHRRRARRVAPRQGARHRRRADPRSLRRLRAARRRALLGSGGRREAAPGRFPGALRDGRARLRRPQPLERRARPRVGRPAPRARRRDRLRPRLCRAHPPRRQAAPLARGQGSPAVRLRAALRLIGRCCRGPIARGGAMLSR